MKIYLENKRFSRSTLQIILISNVEYYRKLTVFIESIRELI